MEYILLEAGHRVVTADDGLSALDVLKSYTPDVVFVDIIMPNIDGKQLCKIIRGMQKLKDVYLFILSAISAEEKMSASDLGVHTCIAKGPFNEMRQNILDLLDQTDQPSPRVLSEEVIGIKSMTNARLNGPNSPTCRIFASQKLRTKCGPSTKRNSNSEQHKNNNNSSSILKKISVN